MPTDEDLGAAMAAAAQDAVDHAQAMHGISLDYSEESIKEVERILGIVHDEYTGRGFIARMLHRGPGAITGTIAASAVAASPYQVTVCATDPVMSASESFSWTVAVISLAPPGDQTSTIGTPAPLTLAASYNGSFPVRYYALDLPPGLQLNRITSAITGTVTLTAQVSYEVTVYATAGAARAEQDFFWSMTMPTGTALSSYANNWQNPTSPYYARNLAEAKYRAWIIMRH